MNHYPLGAYCFMTTWNRMRNTRCCPGSRPLAAERGSMATCHVTEVLLRRKPRISEWSLAEHGPASLWLLLSVRFLVYFKQMTENTDIGIITFCGSPAPEKPECLPLCKPLVKREETGLCQPQGESTVMMSSQNHRASESPACVHRAWVFCTASKRRKIPVIWEMHANITLLILKGSSSKSSPSGSFFFARILTLYSLPSKQDVNTSESFSRRREFSLPVDKTIFLLQM